MPFRGDVSPGFDEALPRLSDEVARSALGVWLSLCEGLFRPAYESGNVWSHPFEAEDRWHCLLVGIGERDSVRYLVALGVVVGDEKAGIGDIEQAQDEWRCWAPRREGPIWRLSQPSRRTITRRRSDDR